MLGINKNGNNIVYVVANFLIVFAMACSAELVFKLPSGIFPTGFELYECVLKGFVAAIGSTAIILGINYRTHKEK